jgi:hypothetical protein
MLVEIVSPLALYVESKPLIIVIDQAFVGEGFVDALPFNICLIRGRIN